MTTRTLIAALLVLALGFGLGRARAPRSDAELSMVTSLSWTLEDPDWLSRSYRLSTFLQHLSPENLPAALEALEPHLPWLNTHELRQLMFAWVRFDAPGALEHALSWPARYRRNASGAAIYAWAFRDPDGARRALDALDDPEVREFMQGRLIAGWMHGSDKQGANDYIASLPSGPRRLNHIGALAWELAREGPDAVVGWAEGIPNGDLRYKEDVFRQASAALAALDPPSTANWLERHLGRPYARGILPVVVRSWATLDPRGALEWLAAKPPGDERKSAVYEAFSVWLDRTPEEAEHWLHSVTPSRDYDPAVRVLVRKNRRDEPATALVWATTIDDPELRERLVSEVAREWAQRDADAATTWLAESDLPRAATDAILAPNARGE